MFLSDSSTSARFLFALLPLLVCDSAGTVLSCDLAGAPKEAHWPQNLANASHSCTEQPTDDTLGDDEYVRSTHVARDCNFEEPVVGDNEQPRPQRRSEPSVGSRRPRNASRGAAIDSQMQTLSKYLEWKMAKKSKENPYDIPECVKRLREMPGIERLGPMWTFCLEMFKSEPERKLFMTLVDDNEACLHWIRTQMNR
ncbi:hypothetical protein HHK36_024467 [Tetracentron sinense]|uniref:Uncharacterized protein n=1 Tax=Tetracentron sinense TaxID=13715 RepID=A0A834YPZ1_TETSI|nr:hypothetical protein HHK36_024467 [Tetracentron sinense]